uniref:HAT C-terminal dimerisation domain-containing protein n=1 Tax=Lepisosteus oculatus TaxID=7918 RepID=W5NNX5_LEPOC
MLPTMEEFITENDLRLDAMKEEIGHHLQALSAHFRKYVPEQQSRDQHDWVRNPFITNAGCQLSSDQQDTILELSSDRTLKAAFSSTPLAQLWLLAVAEYPKLSRLAITVCTLASTWLCETTFSVLTYIKNQSRSHLMTEEDDLRLAVSGIEPRI